MSISGLRTGRRLTERGVRLGRLGLGGAPLGNLYRPMTDAAAADTLAAAWERGVRTIDTAPHYGVGLSEERIGAFLAGVPRAEVVVSTKVGRVLEPSPLERLPRGADGLDEGFAVRRPWRRRLDFTADGVRRSLEGSLERLGVDRVDIALVHDPDDAEATARDQAVPALCALREEGLVGAVGVAMNHSQMLARFVESSDVDVVLCAGRYTLLDQSAALDLLPLAERTGVDVILGGVFNSGVLATSTRRPGVRPTYDYVPAPPGVLERVDRLAAVCRAHGTSLPVAAVHMALAHPAVSGVVLGMGSAAEVAADTALLEAAPSAAFWTELVEEGLLGRDVPVPDGEA